MVDTKTQPTATRSGLPLTGRPAPIVLTGRDDVLSGPEAGRSRADRPVVWAHIPPADARFDDSYPVDGYPVFTSTDLFGDTAAVSPNSMNPSDIRVTTRGIPV